MRFLEAESLVLNSRLDLIALRAEISRQGDAFTKRFITLRAVIGGETCPAFTPIDVTRIAEEANARPDRRSILLTVFDSKTVRLSSDVAECPASFAVESRDAIEKH
jgi:hypothetical protein